MIKGHGSMNLFQQICKMYIDIERLDAKKQQTDYKIKYVSEYTIIWAIISAERSDVKYINFIDCMCNAGIYADGDCCTALEVLNIFIDIAKRHHEKFFNLYLNDYDKSKIDILLKIASLFYIDELVNLKIYPESVSLASN